MPVVIVARPSCRDLRCISHPPLALPLPCAVEHRNVMVAQVAPAVRVTIGEELGLPVGTSATGQLVAALRLLGFDYVFDVLAGADITILEEGTELIHRLRDNLDGNPGAAPLPMFTSCCPGW